MSYKDFHMMLYFNTKEEAQKVYDRLSSMESKVRAKYPACDWYFQYLKKRKREVEIELNTKYNHGMWMTENIIEEIKDMIEEGEIDGVAEMIADELQIEPYQFIRGDKEEYKPERL